MNFYLIMLQEIIYVDYAYVRSSLIWRRFKVLIIGPCNNEIMLFSYLLEF